MTSNDTNNSTIDKSVIGQPYKGAVKMVWKDGQRIQVPDYTLDNAASIATSSTPSSPYVYQKTVEDVISSTDRFQYDRLKTDADRYAFIRNMITGIDSSKYPLFDHEIGGGGIYVERDFRSLDTIIQTLVNSKKVYLDSKTSNLYHYKYALDNKLILLNCPHCSKIVDTGPDGLRMHMWSHQQARR
jgi:hypothetical protein